MNGRPIGGFLFNHVPFFSGEVSLAGRDRFYKTDGKPLSEIDSRLVNQQAGFMKTTLDLPDDLVREVKLHALNENRKLKDAVAELLRKGLAAPEAHVSSRDSAIKMDRKTGLPVIECRKAATPGISSKRAAEILLEQEVKWHEKAGR